MPLSREDNDLLTRVENGAPMGEMIRQHYWIPAIPSAKLVADGAPIRVRLLGSNFATLRTTDGTAAILDEQCRHRKASLLLARVENNSVRCIYHGWNYNARGELIEAPNHVGDQQRFCKSIRVNRYAVREAGGIVWVWLGKGESPPPFPALPFTSLPEDQRAVTSQEVPTNWVQGVEASMDSSHVGVLHESTTKLSAGAGSERVHMTRALAPKFEFEDRPYGYRYAALRAIPENQVYARVNNFIMPWYGLICAPQAKGPATVFFSTPVDDVTHRAWFVHFNPHAPLGITNMSVSSDVWAWPPLPPGTAQNNWGQNRDLMKRGHFSGFPQHLGTEDFAMFLGQGSILDRSDEQLCSADLAVVRVRNLLLQAVREFSAGKVPALAQTSEANYAAIESVGGVIPAGGDWRGLSEKSQA